MAKPMNQKHTRFAATAVLAFALTGATSAALAPGRAHAQLQEGVNSNPFRPAELATDGFQMARPLTQTGLVGAHLTLDYGFRSMEYDHTDPRFDYDYDVVRHHLTGTLALSFRVIDRITAGVGIPLSMVQNGDTPPDNAVFPADGALLADPYIFGRIRILGNAGDRFILGVAGRLTLPVADAIHPYQKWTGEETVTFAPQVLAEVNPSSRFRLNFALGARLRGPSHKRGLYVAQEGTFAVSATYAAVVDRLDLTAEIYGSTDFGYHRMYSSPRSDFLSYYHNNSPIEALVGAQYRPTSNWMVGASVGTRLNPDYGAAAFRGVLTAAYVMSPRATPEPEPEPEPVPVDLDADDDTINDDVDQCVNEAEDMDGFEDTNGCPDNDNDGDGVPDGMDNAPLEPEDVDTFQDEDGAPDPDNDADGIADVSDRCPMVAGPAAEGGCPPPDRDNDTVPDSVDNCPDVAGTPENQGCTVVQQVHISGDILEITDNVYFATNRSRIEARSFALLDNIAAVVSAHPEIMRVRVEGHTDARGNRARNVRLSQGRADAVARYLRDRGVGAERVIAIGLGPDHPIVPNATTPEDNARNRRVEFHIESAPAPATTP